MIFFLSKTVLFYKNNSPAAGYFSQFFITENHESLILPRTQEEKIRFGSSLPIKYVKTKTRKIRKKLTKEYSCLWICLNKLSTKFWMVMFQTRCRPYCLTPQGLNKQNFRCKSNFNDFRAWIYTPLYLHS